MNLCYIDVETTGLQSASNDIIQLAGILEVGGQEVDTFNYCMKPLNWGAISHKALEVNHRTLDELRTFEEPKAVFKKFVEKVGKHIDKKDKKTRWVMCGQNVTFDAGFLKSFFAKMGYDNYAFSSLFDYRTIDLMTLNYLLIHLGLMKVENIKLGTVTETYGISIENAHDAGYDIRATKDVMDIIKKAFIKTPAEIDLNSLIKDSPIYKHIQQLKS